MTRSFEARLTSAPPEKKQKQKKAFWGESRREAGPQGEGVTDRKTPTRGGEAII